MLLTRKLINYKDTYKLKVKRQKKIYNANSE